MASRSIRHLAIGVGLLALLAVVAPGHVHAQAPTATIAASQERNFGRLIFNLPSFQPVKARVANGVLIVNFAEPVSIREIDQVVRAMPQYISVARLDPDGRGARFALVRPYSTNVMEAGERVFVDLIPPNWQGLLPSLPQEVVAELVTRAKVAEELARQGGRVARTQPPREIEVRTARLPTLSRLIFEIPKDVSFEGEVNDNTVSLSFGSNTTLDPAKLRSVLPEGVRLASHEMDGPALRVRLDIADDRTVRGFREEDGFTVDVAPKNTPARPQLPAPRRPAPAEELPSVAQQPARPAPADPQPAPARAGAAEPASPTEPAAAPPAPRAAPALPPQDVAIKVTSSPDGSRIDFAFPRRTAAAGFEDRGEIVLVFDTVDRLDVSSLASSAPGFVLGASQNREGRATILRLKLQGGGVMRMAADGNAWALTTGETGVAARSLLRPTRAMDDTGLTVISVPLAGVSAVHWINLEEAGPAAVATAYGPGASLPKPHRFVDVLLDTTMQGLLVRPIADDVTVRSGVSDVRISRAGGMMVSLDAAPQPDAIATRAADKVITRDWVEHTLGDPRSTMAELVRNAAAAGRSDRVGARLKLATHLLANGLQMEALGPLGALAREDQGMDRNPRVVMMTGIAQTMAHRPKQALATLNADPVKDNDEAALWRAINDSREGRHGRALPVFKRLESILNDYPDSFQAMIRPDIIRTAIAMRDQALAEKQLGIVDDFAPMYLHRDQVALMRAEFDEISGRVDAAMSGYKALFDSTVRPVSARAQLRGVQLASRENDPSLSRDEAQTRLETVAITWRGDEVEIEALGEIGNFYIQDQRWRDAFHLARKASSVFPDHPISRKLHDDASNAFEELFTSGKGDSLPRAEAVALFFDFREFLPVGRRGDQITRRLADKLVELDLLEQASELLEHQINHRVTGVQRATVAARLAMIRLMNRQPAEALRALGNSRMAELPRDVRRARQLLEAKALSDLSRTDLALDLLSGESGPDVDRLRADVLWTARRWREAGEAHERILGEVWRKAEPLSERERADALRAAVAYVMAEEALSLDRLRTKFAAPMAQTPDARMFGFVTSMDRARPADIRELTRAVANADTLTEFMNEYRKRYPDMATSPRGRAVRPPAAEAPAQPPAAEPQRQAEGQPPQRQG